MSISKRTLSLVILLSLIMGFLGGGIGALTIFALSHYSATSTVSQVLPPSSSGERATIDIAKKALPAVVSINISKNISTQGSGNFPGLFNDPFSLLPTPPSSGGSSQNRQLQIGGGSGFFVSAEGLIVTNKHVVSDAVAQYTVVTQEGKKYPAKVVALDPVLDLAIIKIDGRNFPTLELGDSDRIQVGETVVAIGNALAEFQNSVTKGIVSGINRRLVAGDIGATELIEGAIQTDAAINPGNSGGPLLDLSGHVIGVNTAISEGAQSLGFALPINSVKRDLDSVKKNGRIIRPWIGVRYVPIDDQLANAQLLSYSYGALIVGGGTHEPAVVPSSPAAKAGLAERDIILEVNGQRVDTNHSLSALIAPFTVGDKVTLKVSNQGKEKTISLTLEERK